MSWGKVKISEVIEKPITGEWGDSEGETKILRTTNFTNSGEISFAEVVKRNISPKKIELKKLRFGDSILEKSGGSPTQPVGRVVFYNINEDETYLCNNFTTILRPINSVNPKYLFWFLFKNHIFKQTLAFQNKTTGIINLKTERYLSETEIPLPPLATQKAIAEKLDKADALRKKDQQLLKLYDELAQSVFIEMFGDPVRNDKGWDVTVFGKVIKNLNSQRIPLKSSDRDALEEVYPYYGASGVIDFVDDYLFEGENLLIGEDGANLISRSTPIAFIATGRYWVNNHAHVLGFDGKAELEFLKFYINNIDLTPYITGSAQPKLTRGNLDNLKIFIPPLSLQQKFTSIIKNINAQKVLVKQQAAESENLFQSLLQESFS